MMNERASPIPAATAGQAAGATNPSGGEPAATGANQRARRRSGWVMMGALLFLVLLSIVLRSHEEVARWYRAAARVEYSRGHRGPAMALLKQAIEWHPKDPEPYRRLAAWYQADGQDDLCLQNWQAVIDLRPNDPGSYWGRCVDYGRMQRYEEAFRDADTALHLMRDGYGGFLPTGLNVAGYYRALAGKELDRGFRDADEAVDMLRSAVRDYSSPLQGSAGSREVVRQLNAKLAATLDTRGYLHYLRDDLPASRADLDEAIDLQWQSIDLVRAEMLAGERLSRDAWLGQLQLAREGLGEMYYHRALVFTRQGETRRASDDRRRAKAYGFDVDRGHAPG